VKRVALAVLLLALLGMAACGDDQPESAVEVPAWAKVAPEQIAEARNHGVPVAFENDLGMRFVLIPSGTFVMGSPEDEKGRGNDETQHEVTITKPYYTQVTEVTNGQYSAWKQGYGKRLNSERSRKLLGLPYSLGADRQPTVMQSPAQARAFAEWLTDRSKARTYRLPSEEEWEYSCRAGTTTAFNVGDTLPDNLANDGTAPIARESDGGTVFVGSYPPNGWGLYDMHGNVSEWCRGLRDIGVPEVGSMFVQNTRGGSHDDSARALRSAHRGDFIPTAGSPYIGFRLVSPLPEPQTGAR